MKYNATTWPFTESPWTITLTCNLLKVEWTEINDALCIISTLVGFISAYILPLVISTSVPIYTTLIVVQVMSATTKRSSIYYTGLLVAVVMMYIVFGVFTYFLPKGLSYTTNGEAYFFVYYHSQISCQIYRFSQAFSSTLFSNIFLGSAIDRTLTVYKPVLYANLPNKYARIFLAVIFIVTFTMALPFFILAGLIEIGDKIHCWFESKSEYLLFFRAFCSHLAPIQLILATLINLAFFRRILRSTKQDSSNKPANDADRTKIKGSLFLVINSSTFLIFGLPGSIFDTIKNAHMLGLINVNVDLYQNLFDLIWSIFLCRSTFDLLVGFFYFKPEKDMFASVFRKFTESIRSVIKCLFKRGVHTVAPN